MTEQPSQPKQPGTDATPPAVGPSRSGHSLPPPEQMRSRARRRARRRWYHSRWVRAVTVLLVLVLVGPLLLPARSARDTLAPEQLAWPASRWVEVEGVRLHYEVHGSGEPALVLLHGFGASTFSWRDVVEPLGRAATVIAFDRPGFGLSGRPMPGEWSGANPYGDAAYAAQTVGLLDSLGLERAVLVGHSAGATVAALTALTYPERVSGLVLIAPAPAVGGRHGLIGVLGCLAASPQMRRIGPRLLHLMLGRLESVLDMSWHHPEQVTKEIREGYKRPLQADNWDRALWEIVLSPKVGGLGERAGELGAVPVLYITGDSDRIVSPAATAGLAARTPGADLLTLPQCGHLPQEEYPAEVAAALLEFLARRMSGPGE